jgi:2,3-bisphosphoglycerate-independent phosphoglycerate mutase
LLKIDSNEQKSNSYDIRWLGKISWPKVSAIDNIPFINSLYKKYPSAQLRTDGLNVGLPEGQMGNSEVGHMNLGAGRIVYQDLAR